MQSLIHLGDLVSRVAEFGLLDWMGRVKLIDCICDFVLLSPQIGQVITVRNIHYIWSLTCVKHGEMFAKGRFGCVIDNFGICTTGTG